MLAILLWVLGHVCLVIFLCAAFLFLHAVLGELAVLAPWGTLLVGMVAL